MLKRICLLAVVAVVAVSARAQGSAEPCTSGIFGFGYGPGGRTGVAYTAKIKSTFEQNLADGNRIHGTAHEALARTGSGKTFWQRVQSCRRAENGQMQAVLQNTVWDSGARTTTSWSTGSDERKVIFVSHQSDVPRIPAPPPTAEEVAERKRTAASRSQHREFVTEDLGTETIAGVEAHGTRSTFTVAAGEMGNDSPLVTVRETWTAQKLGLVVKAITDDPRNGRSTYEVEELTLGEPDAALFVPPAGYTVEDSTSTIKVLPPAAQ